jgi:PLP dependent protein
VDRPSLAKQLDQCSLGIRSFIPILIEINTSGEITKAGVNDWQKMLNLLEVIRACSRLRVKGLMTVAPLTKDQDVLRGCFSTLRLWKNQLCQQAPDFCWDTLSMGMSNDFHLAIEEGSTLVRIGTKFFEG